MNICLNRITSPALGLKEFLALASACACKGVELRNDLGNTHPYDNLDPAEVRKLLSQFNLEVVSINAQQRFNDGNPIRVEELETLLELGKNIGTKAIVLCPANGIEPTEDHNRWFDQTTEALAAFGPLFLQYKMLGYVEPLGFTVSSLRTKADAIQAIRLSGYEACYKVVHDTFHHHLAAEQQLFVPMTGLVHTSSVSPEVNKEATDADRLILLDNDLLKSKEQVFSLLKEGYEGPVSFEPFSPQVQQLPRKQLEHLLKESILSL